MPHPEQLSSPEISSSEKRHLASTLCPSPESSPSENPASTLQNEFDRPSPRTLRDGADLLNIDSVPVSSAPPHHLSQSSSSQSSSSQSGPSQSVVDLTVVIPTYNGAARLPMVLDRLRAQTHLNNVCWDIIVCDNGSTDDTATVVHQYQAAWQTNWPAHVPLHYRFAAEQGAAFARQHAVESAQGKLIAFLDDDNLPADDWLAKAIAFAQTHPEAGAFGSQIHGKFESELPQELENIKCFLAIIERGDQAHLYKPANKILPPAAGLIVRKAAWLSAVPPRLFLNNKGKEAGLASEDLEALLHIQKAGYDIWYNPEMVVHHDIPDGRLRKDYLVTLFRCVGLSRFHIRLLGIESWKRPVAIPAYIANDIRKLAFHRLRYGRRQQLSTPENCHRTLLKSTVVSPFFLLKKVYEDAVQDREDRQHSDRTQWLAHLTQAFEQDRFRLYQQPVMNVGSSVGNSQQSTQPTQKELLLRLRTAENDCVLPHQFLPTAQRYQLMRTLDRWVIRNLLSSTAHVPQTDEAHSHPPLYAINLSADSVRDPKLAAFITEKITAFNLPTGWFCFEIASNIAVANPAATRNLIEALHHIGCRVTLDRVALNDVTAGREITALLQNLTIDYIKLESARLFADQSPSSQIIHAWSHIKPLIRDGATEAIATGIESEALLQAVQQQGIQYAQGYQMARPQPL
ncbi:MAG: hormogonium polysaccharide biosynthesis glycosyltransferase HpsE [Phormidesmis sp.]